MRNIDFSDTFLGTIASFQRLRRHMLDYKINANLDGDAYTYLIKTIDHLEAASLLEWAIKSPRKYFKIVNRILGLTLKPKTTRQFLRMNAYAHFLCSVGCATAFHRNLYISTKSKYKKKSFGARFDIHFNEDYRDSLAIVLNHVFYDLKIKDFDIVLKLLFRKSHKQIDDKCCDFETRIYQKIARANRLLNITRGGYLLSISGLTPYLPKREEIVDIKNVSPRGGVIWARLYGERMGVSYFSYREVRFMSRSIVSLGRVVSETTNKSILKKTLPFGILARG